VQTEYWSTDNAKKLMRWYRYLFLTKSKPSTHLRVMSQLEASELSRPPEVLAKLIERIKNELQLT
jgi:putative ATP-dependent endonuclease of OLD family